MLTFTSFAYVASQFWQNPSRKSYKHLSIWAVNYDFDSPFYLRQILHIWFFRDILFGTIFDKFSQDSIAKGVFLECLEPYILNDKLNSVTPIVMQDFVEHYKNREMVENVEGCIVHMDIASLDIHQVSGTKPSL